jgi:uncharacterized protein DUF2868
MREMDLRAVLLVKAIEETDREGRILAPADRLAAARDARREGGDAVPMRMDAARLPAGAQRMLVRRARILLARVRASHAFVDEVLGFRAGRWIAIALAVVAFAVGLALSALDGSQRINVLAFPLWGLVAWNFLVYAIVAAAALRAMSRRAHTVRALHGWTVDAIASRLSAAIARARRYHAPLADALARYALEWQGAVRPRLASRAAAAFHVAAAILAAGLAAGLYLRGVVLDYQAGWESTFLDAARVHQVLAVLYAPASWLTGIPIPDAARLEAIRWRDGAGGENAARWIHLLAATLLLLVMVPRLVLAAIALARSVAGPALPPSLTPYFLASFREAGVSVEGGEVRVIAYAYEPTEAALAALRSLLAREMGDHISLAAVGAVPYGEEESAPQAIGSGAGAVVLLFTLAATPEDENHGRVIELVRDAPAVRAGSAPLRIVVDEAPYAARMGEALAARLEERRRAWRDFVAARGLQAQIVDLAR